MVYRRHPNGHYVFEPGDRENARPMSLAEAASEHANILNDLPGAAHSEDAKKRPWTTRLSQAKNWLIWHFNYMSRGLLLRRNFPVLDGIGSEDLESEVYDEDSEDSSEAPSRRLDPTFRPATEEILRQLSDPERLQQLDGIIQAERPPGPWVGAPIYDYFRQHRQYS